MLSQSSAQRLLEVCKEALTLIQPMIRVVDDLPQAAEAIGTTATEIAMKNAEMRISPYRTLASELRAAIEAAEQDELRAACEARRPGAGVAIIAAAKADALKAAREVDRKAQRVTDHRFLEQNGG